MWISKHFTVPSLLLVFVETRTYATLVGVGAGRAEGIEELGILEELRELEEAGHQPTFCCFVYFPCHSLLLLLAKTGDVLLVDFARVGGHELAQEPDILIINHDLVLAQHTLSLLFCVWVLHV